MFIQAVLIAIVIGYILKGRLRNLENTKLQGVYFIVAGFGLEFLVIMAIRSGFFSRGILTFCIDLLMYAFLFWFIYLNKKNPFVLIMGMGFLLNAIPIFLNGGAMPVDVSVYNAVGITGELTKEGLYTAISGSTKAWFLGDIFPYHFISRLVISIGDIVIEAGLILFIITGMKKKSN